MTSLENTDFAPAAGGCTCRYVRYHRLADPIIVHCCHCRWCQRETGSAFALNAVIEADRVELLAGEVEVIDTPSQSGNGQRITRSPKCRIAIWSNYHQAGPGVRFMRVGTLDEPDRLAPDIHIYTSSKQPWVTIPAGARSAPEFHNAREVWRRSRCSVFSRLKRGALVPIADATLSAPPSWLRSTTSP